MVFRGKAVKKIFILLLLFMYITGCSNSNIGRDVDGRIIAEVYESPERVIDEYYRAIKRGDEDFLNELFVRDPHINLQRAIPEIEYKVRGSRIITANEAWQRNQTSSSNKLQEGDFEVVVEEILSKTSEEITFILRRIDNRWKIYSHSLGYYI